MKIIKAIGIFVAGMFTFYLATAFVQWNINPNDWSMDARLMCVMLGFLFSPIAVAIYVNELEGK